MKKIIIALSLSVALSACTSNPKDPQAQSNCTNLLNQGYSELKLGQANSLKGSANWTAASSLLTTASAKQGFADYDGCVNSAQSALKYIKENQKNYAASAK